MARPDDAPGVYQELLGAHAVASAGDVEINNYFAVAADGDMEPRDDDEREDAEQDRFKRRFGFRAKAEARADVLRIKREYALSRNEVRLAKMAGAIRVRDDGAQPSPSLLLLVIGWIEAAICAALFCGAVSALIWKAPTSPRVIEQLVLVAMVSLVACCLTYLCHVKANRLLSQSRRTRFGDASRRTVG